MSDHGEVIHQLNELQQQKGDILDASQQMSMKYSSVQGEVYMINMSVPLFVYLLTAGCLFVACYLQQITGQYL